jgi:hypothetical protein
VQTPEGGTVKVTASVRGRAPVVMAARHGNRNAEGQVSLSVSMLALLQPRAFSLIFLCVRACSEFYTLSSVQVNSRCNKRIRQLSDCSESP